MGWYLSKRIPPSPSVTASPTGRLFYGGSKPPPYHKTGACPPGRLKKIPRFAEESIVETRVYYDRGG